MSKQSEQSQWSWAQPSTNSSDVAQDYDAFATEYDETVASWRYEAPSIAAPLLLKQLGGIILFTSRTDLWQQRDYPAMLDRIKADGIW